MRVFVPNPLHSYTHGRAEVEGAGASLTELLADLDRRYPGFRFRIIDEQGAIREHIKIFLNEDQIRILSVPVNSNDVVHIICGLSGGVPSDLDPPYA